MFEEKDRTIFDSADLPETLDSGREGASPTEKMARPTEVEKQPPRSFADWIAQGYLLG